MIDLSESVARKTVKFDRPVKGEDLIKAVQAACDDRFYQDSRYDDGMQYVVGQSSRHPSKNLLVTPDKSNAYLDPDKLYESAVVIRHDAPASGMMYAVNVSRETEIQAVLDFAEKLPKFLPAGQEQAGPERFLDAHAPAAGATRRGGAEAPSPRHGTTASTGPTQTWSRDQW